jgi:dTDP-4-dehydrorhamnose 3,5-epimerase
MRFIETRLSGSYIIDIEPRVDERGFFSRTYCEREFTEHGLKARIVQANLSFNHVAGTLRGMHMQLAPAAEAKLVRCTRGAIYDAIVDMRADSPSYLQHVGVELSAENRRALYVPPGFAHGYLTLADDTEVEYQVSEFYTPGAERGFRYDDPMLKINWPRTVTRISEKDRAWTLLADVTDPVAR